MITGLAFGTLAPGHDEEGSYPSPTLVDPPRAFHPDSWWNTPLPVAAPLHAHGPAILRYLSTAPQSGGGCLYLAGTRANPWGQPIYEAQRSDAEYDVSGEMQERPPELDDLRIPAGARPADNDDASMTVYDRDRGYVMALSGAQHDEENDTWSATGATVTYLDSNGLHVDTGRSDDARNRGSHRGNNGAIMAVTAAEVESGAISHVLKIAIGPEASSRWLFPMVGSDGDYLGQDPAVPPEGLRLRLSPSLDLDDFGLDPTALVIARALQKYGAYIGDSGGRTSLKLENTVVEGLGIEWTLPDDALCRLRFTPDNWDVIAAGYDPTADRGDAR